MDLLLDLGHTRLKWAWWSAQGVHAYGASVWAGIRPAVLIDGFGPCDQPPRRIAIAAVAGARLVEELLPTLRGRFGVEPVLLRATARCAGVVNGYAEPGQLGVDRWAGVLGAWGRVPGSAGVVVDAGSALTIDFVDRDGRHLGGSIAPGLALAQAAFYDRTGRQAQVGAALTDGTARTTADAVATGALLGAVGAVERAWRRHAARSPDGCRVWLTGGDAPVLSDALEVSHTVAAHLVFEGMAQMLGGYP